MTQKIIIYTDGGSRGNPGPAAIGVIINNKGYSKFLGEKTNNEAEYEAVIFALKKAKQLFGKKNLKEAEIIVNMDSELIVNQLNHQYKIEGEKIAPLFLKVWNLLLDFGHVKFQHIPREQNKEADRLVNAALDSML